MSCIIPHDLVVERRARRNIRVSVLPDGSVRVSAPDGARIEDFLNNHREWIITKQRQMETLAAGHERSKHRLLLHGRYCELVLDSTGMIDEAAGIVRYITPADLKVKLHTMLMDDLRSCIDRTGTEMGVRCQKIRIRMQKTRWGSCSMKGTLHFNLRSIALPAWLLEYLVVHELSHLLVPNHSPKFWNTVEQYSGDFRLAEQELKRFWVIIERNEIWKILSRVHG